MAAHRTFCTHPLSVACVCRNCQSQSSQHGIRYGLNCHQHASMFLCALPLLCLSMYQLRLYGMFSLLLQQQAHRNVLTVFSSFLQPAAIAPEQPVNSAAPLSDVTGVSWPSLGDALEQPKRKKDSRPLSTGGSPTAAASEASATSSSSSTQGQGVGGMLCLQLSII